MRKVIIIVAIIAVVGAIALSFLPSNNTATFIYPKEVVKETQIPGDDMQIGKFKRKAPAQAREFCEDNREDILCKP